MKGTFSLLFIAGLVFCIASCHKDIAGCTDPKSYNFNPKAEVNDGSCKAKVYGCTDTASYNYNPKANVNNGSCIPKVYGCTDSTSINFNPKANVNNGTCEYASGQLVVWEPGCNGDPEYVTVNGMVEFIALGFTSAPKCGEGYAATFSLAPGAYKVWVVDALLSDTSNYTVKITPNNCTNLEVR